MSKAAVLQTLTEVGTVTNALGGLTVSQGRTRYQDSTDAENDVRALTVEVQGKLWYWMDEYRGAQQTKTTEMTIMVMYECRMAKDSSSTLQSLVGKIMDIVTALQLESNFTMARPMGVNVKRSPDDLENNIAQWELSTRFMVGPTCGA